MLCMKNQIQSIAYEINRKNSSNYNHFLSNKIHFRFRHPSSSYKLLSLYLFDSGKHILKYAITLIFEKSNRKFVKLN